MKTMMGWATILLSTMAWSVEPSQLLQDKLNHLKTFQANFSQTVTAGKKHLSTSSGSMALQRPSLFRWETKKPMAQTIVADGNKLWIYDIELEQVTVKKQEKGVGGTPGLFLSSSSHSVAQDFAVTMNEAGLQQTFDLKAKSPQESYQQLQLQFNGATLTDIKFLDQLGQTTAIHLTQAKINPPLSGRLFKFVLPKGVDVVNQ